MSDQIIEIFLFIDPLGRRCNNVRKIVNKFRDERLENVKLRIIPVVNFKRVYGYARKNTKSDYKSFLELNNHFSSNTYRASLAFHACAMQGKNKAHQFLNVLQEMVVEEGIDFSEELILQIVEEIGLDFDMFEEDYHSNLVKRIYQKNLRLASEMDVIGTPSCVIYRGDTEDEAIRLNQKIEYDVLHSICGVKKTEHNSNKKISKKEKVIQGNIKNIVSLNFL